MAKNNKTSEFVEAEKVEDELNEEEFEDEELEEDDEELEEDEEDEEEFEEEEEEPKKESKSFIQWVRDNSLVIISGIVGILIGVVIMALMWPERIATLSNGEEVAAVYNGKTITANDIYNKIKGKVGLSTVLEKVDIEYLKEKYKDQLEELKESSKAGIEQYISYYTSMLGYTETEFYDQMGFKGYDDMLEYMFNNSLREKYIDDYVSQSISETDIKAFYSLYAFGDKEIVYVFTGENKDDLESVRSMLKNKKAFNTIDGKYESVTASEFSDVSFIDLYKEYGGEICEAIKGIKNAGYSKVISSKSYKYFVVYASGKAETADLTSGLSDEIKQALIDDEKSINSKVGEQALIKMRNEIGLEFKDSELAKAYEEHKKQYE